MDTIEPLIDDILDREGRAFTDRPNDRGGPTHFGVTLPALAQWHRRRGLPPATLADLRALDEPGARLLYRELYIVGPRFDRIADSLLRHNLVDAGVLHGRGWAARRLQEVLGVAVDGIVGPKTLGAIARSPVKAALNLRFTRRRIDRVVRIVRADPTQLEWLVGWTNRANRFLDIEAEMMAAR